MRLVIKMENFVMKRKDNYWWERTLVMFGRPLIMALVPTTVTPNMVTIFNLVIVFSTICITCVLKQYFILAVLVQLYMFLDVVDGNLARNKNMKSELGRKLDIFADTLFYILGYFLIGLAVEAPVWLVVLAIVVQQIYGLVATYYIAPKIRKLKVFKHTKLKEYFIKKDILFGMDASLECFVTSVLLVFPFRKIVFVVCPILWSVDLIYRLYELNIVNKNNV